ncbi:MULTISPECIES: PadR family transcriptional regulator [Dyadobacter]|jgi:PadR family transcriptional regulator PadR|uniref:PadR family transcriptional regulator n=1 Tax=Dyadobacter chenhuakuii TaxID=2909339 RepID=A0ABY4XM77_9BACT|nr:MULTISPECIES: helix-turn-helix transcriptional regulator [Dyadobacter]MCE7071067.1 PadR family transcriptional regulator [Dyadobacter sp. CY327]MCF2494044.1 PadR family transcriptional regulator [Dyadobacter chenhuakuii]USJ31173.1 PadR family transcriptional regulator [Dyadobacter chenhuakuii]
MKKTILGELEELVLLVVAASTEQMYGVPVMEQLQLHAGRSFTIGAVHTTLYRLEEKGFLSSSVGGATTDRGGRRKRFFALTAAGATVLAEIRTMRENLWQAIPEGKFKLLGQ